MRSKPIKQPFLIVCLVLLLAALLSACGLSDKDKKSAMQILEKEAAPATIADLQQKIEAEIDSHPESKENVGKGSYEWRFAKDMDGNIAARYGYFRPKPNGWQWWVGGILDDAIGWNPWPDDDIGVYIGFIVDLKAETARLMDSEDQDSVDSRKFWIGQQ